MFLILTEINFIFVIIQSYFAVLVLPLVKIFYIYANLCFESYCEIGYDVNGMIGTKLMRCNEIAKAFFA